MSTKNDPAFPRLKWLRKDSGPIASGDFRAENIGGLTKLEWFAGLVMPAILDRLNLGIIYFTTC